MALLCDRMDINIWEVVSCQNQAVWLCHFTPGLVLEGHCIPIDPYYLSWKAKEFHFNTALIETAGNINQKMPEYVVDKIGIILNSVGKCYKDSKIVILGVAYKKDIDDYRESPTLRIFDMLVKFGADIVVVDPHIEEFKDKDGSRQKTTSLSQDSLKCRFGFGCHDHSKFDKEFILSNSKLIYDTRNFIKVMIKVIRL